MRLIFMGTPEFAVPSLQRLVDEGHEVAAVFTQPDKPAGRGKIVQQPPVKLTASAHSIPCYQPAKIKTNEEVRAIFTEIAPDACAVAAYGKILPPWLLEIPRLGCINVHASLLPKYRGAAPINWAIANGETVTGISIMQMDAGMDTGPIWAQRSTKIGTDETAPELSSRLSQLGADLLAETLPVIGTGDASPYTQDNNDASYSPILKKEDGLIDWGFPAKKIADRVRAFQPWPGSYTLFRGSRLVIWTARVPESKRIPNVSVGRDSLRALTERQVLPPASILATDKAGFDVMCGDGTWLRVEELQIEGKKRVTAIDFLNGTRLSTGDRIAA
ncbi:MAG TPA: methionyl-tRNA formyltransferase [Blastocatellia bacterium]